MRRRGPPMAKRKDIFVNNHRNTALESSPSLDDSSIHNGQTHQECQPTDNLMSDFNQSRTPASYSLSQLAPMFQASGYPRTLDATETRLLEHYIQRFSRQYPTCSGPTNPFLSVFIPLAMRSDVVLDSLLSLSGAQHWDHGWAFMENESLKLRQRALRGTRTLLSFDEVSSHKRTGPDSQVNGQRMSPNSTSRSLSCQATTNNEENLLFLLTSSVLFLLYEKVSGEPSWKPHIEFINQFFDRWMGYVGVESSVSKEVAEATKFLFDIFIYNDLVRSTTLQAPTLSKFYLTACDTDASSNQSEGTNRYYFPNLIARLSNGDESVSDEDIADWDGSLDWLPSFALDTKLHDHGSQSHHLNHETSRSVSHQWDDQTIISELYRTAARVYRLRMIERQKRNNFSHQYYSNDETSTLPHLANQAHSLMLSLPEGSVYENALLWPLGIAAKELTTYQSVERADVISRLKSLDNRFQMRHFRRVQDVLMRHWTIRDSESEPNTDLTTQNDTDEIILLG